MILRRIVPVAILLLTHWALPIFGDGREDNQAKNVRSIPPLGVEISAEVRRQLEDRVQQLKSAIGQLEQRRDALTQALLPDVQIFSKAAQWALRYDEIFHRDDLKRIDLCINSGLERAAQLVGGKAPWTDARGLVVRGYISRIDGSIQPYGLVIPESYTHRTAGRYRLDIWFHGRGETLSEANFLADRMKNPGQFTPPDTIVLHPYGRYCNAFKFAGEEDVNEALESVKRQYRIDEDRISVRGFSMGGAAAWHFAVHYPTRWFAANPGAGFSETPDFLRVFQKEEIDPAPWERRLLHYYDCTDWARNLENCPTVAYSGELDAQKQAADIMAQALANEGMELQHIIGPQTKHRYHPRAAEQVELRMTELSRAGRFKGNTPTRFVTYTLRYNQARDLTIDALKEHWKRAEIDYRLSNERAEGAHNSGSHDDRAPFKPRPSRIRIDIRTQNVTAFSIALPAGTVHPRSTAEVRLDGHDVTAPIAKTDGSWTPHFRLDGDEWRGDPADDKGLRKRHGLQGPIDDAFLGSFLFVRPTRTARHESVEKWSRGELDRAIRQWRRQMRGDVRAKDDNALTDGDIKAHHLVLWGDSQSNTVLGRIADRLPIQWDADKIVVGKRLFPAAAHALVLVYPNPLNPNRYIVLNSGLTYREYDYLNNARQAPKLPDWAVVDLTVPPGPRHCGRIAAADFFDEAWQLK